MPPPKRPHHPSAPPPPEAFGELPPSLEPFEVELVDNLDKLSSTERGDGGFGSTTGVVKITKRNKN